MRLRSSRATVVVVLAFALSWPLGPANAATEASEVADKVATVQQEVLGLLERLAASGCLFYRNGSWYEGPEAAAHLRRKFNYIAKRRSLESAEQFIELGATESSFSGRAYQVRCGTGEPEASQQWLIGQLGQWRQGRAKPRARDSGAQ